METLQIKNMTQTNGTRMTNSPILIAKKCRKAIIKSEYLKKFAKHIKKEYGQQLTKTAGFCGIASAFLYTKLKYHKYKPKIVWGQYNLYSYGRVIQSHGHAWVLLGNTIIDITADQFGDKPVVIKKSSYKKYIPIKVLSLNKNDWQNWSVKQRPTKYKLKNLRKTYATL